MEFKDSNHLYIDIEQTTKLRDDLNICLNTKVMYIVRYKLNEVEYEETLNEVNYKNFLKFHNNDIISVKMIQDYN